MRAKLLLLLATSALCLAIVETLFYVWFPQPTYAVRYAPWGFEHIPGISFKHTPESKETISHITYNSEGFRGPEEYAIRKPAGTFRVAILGDSYAEGAEVDHQYLHATVLEGALNEYLADRRSPYTRAEVIKAGVYAYDSCQELRLFEARVRKYGPDAVFVIYTGERAANTTFCALEDGELVYRNMEYGTIQAMARYMVGYLNAKSHLLNYLYRLYRFQLGGRVRLPAQLNQTFDYEPPQNMGFDPSASVSRPAIGTYTLMPREDLLDPATWDDDYALRLTFEIFRRLNEAVEDQGGRHFIVFSHRPLVGAGLAHYSQANGISMLDVHSYLLDRRTQATHLAVDGHWNEYGHLLVAEALFDLLRMEFFEPSNDERGSP